MYVPSALRKRTHALLGPLLGLALVGYFGYHLVEGDRGLVAWLQLTQQIRDSKATLADLRNERVALDHRVSLLRPEHLDPDMLDERARATLNYASPNEVVILRGDKAR
jgi:cell division protein FtsB